ncbi:hypothetical protein M5D96_000195 [Drosophila gunungcola]|uniref:Uncharacterized protein n=1 Tax=Drosophila gunungcola TaxID=103775 RepID=A0A9Q0BTX3_9MUSC|nr:hypothetical protein M5D96_000195 [Drosophila gunungcola]
MLIDRLVLLLCILAFVAATHNQTLVTPTPNQNLVTATPKVPTQVCQRRGGYCREQTDCCSGNCIHVAGECQ